MSVDQSDVIDFIGREKDTGDIVLTVSDHLDWAEQNEHLYALQEKLNTYIQFVESGQLRDEYPDTEGKRVGIQVFFQHPPPPGDARAFLHSVKDTIESIGLFFRCSSYEQKA